MGFLDDISVYIHWPFCLSKCPYCDFNSHVSSSIDHDHWTDAYLREIDNFSHILKNRRLKSIFFGGGTPSLMKPNSVEKIIGKILDLSKSSIENIEITLEANPTSVEVSKFIDFSLAGINRVSIGVQSFDEDELKFLGRNHSGNEAIKAISIASKYFERFSFDLIYALPNQSLEKWKSNLKKALELARSHISLYQLTIEKGTKFYSMYRKGEFKLPEQEFSHEMYEITNEILSGHGLYRYEISNYAVEGQESIHNLSYWNYDEYIGVGPGAHGRVFENRKLCATTMIYSPEAFLKSIKENGSAIKEKVELDEREILIEIMMMGTRLVSGMSEKKINKYLNKTFLEVIGIDKINELVGLGLINHTSEKIIPTNKGLALNSYMLNKIFADYMQT